jgi:hypothetical protein
MNLADVLANADPMSEPARNQIGLLDGERTVVMRCVLDRTAVIELDGRRVLVRFDRLDVDPATLCWQKKSATAQHAFMRGSQMQRARNRAAHKSKARR